MSLAAFFTEENRNRYAPFSLTGNTPILSLLNHICNSVMTPSRNPLNAVDCLASFILEVLNRTEPLVGSSEKDRSFTSPTVRILVNNLL